jgi:hypothetical protein
LGEAANCLRDLFVNLHVCRKKRYELSQEPRGLLIQDTGDVVKAAAAKVRGNNLAHGE